MNKKIWIMSGLILLLAAGTSYIIWAVLAAERGSDHVMDKPGQPAQGQDTVFVKPLPDSVQPY